MGNAMNFLIQLMSSGNPQGTIQNMMRQNPQYNAILNQQRQSGMSMEQFVRQYAQQNNIDIAPMINFLNQKGIR